MNGVQRQSPLGLIKGFIQQGRHTAVITIERAAIEPSVAIALAPGISQAAIAVDNSGDRSDRPTR